jgi:hypothetical protein
MNFGQYQQDKSVSGFDKANENAIVGGRAGLRGLFYKLCRPYGTRIYFLHYRGLTPTAKTNIAAARLIRFYTSPFCPIV